MPEMTDTNRNTNDEGEFSSTWSRFVGALKRLLSGVPQQRALDPYMPLRDAALQAAESPQLKNELEAAWLKLHGPKNEGTAPQIAHLLLMELRAFPSAVEIAEAEQNAQKEPSLSKRHLLSIGETTIDSIKDILENLPPLAKGALTALSEILKIFRGD